MTNKHLVDFPLCDIPMLCVDFPLCETFAKISSMSPITGFLTMKSEEGSAKLADDAPKELLHTLHVKYLATYSSNPKHAMVCITISSKQPFTKANLLLPCSTQSLKYIKQVSYSGFTAYYCKLVEILMMLSLFLPK